MNPWLGVLVVVIVWLVAVLLVWAFVAGAARIEQRHNTPSRGGTTTEGGDA